MTRVARLTQKRLEGEILKLLEGRGANLYDHDCAFCKKYYKRKKSKRSGRCLTCPLELNYPGEGCDHNDFDSIDTLMCWNDPDAIPGALAIYMWLEEL